MKNIIQKGLLAGSLLSISAAVSAQDCAYVTPFGGWNSSEWYKVIDCDFTKFPKTFTGLDGSKTANNSDFASGEIGLTMHDDNDNPTAKTWPMTYHMATFAPDDVASAEAKIEEYGINPSGSAPCYINDYSVIPYKVSKGFVELSRLGASEEEPEVSRHGYVIIPNIPHVERVQWSYSSTGWKRGIKMDIKIGDGEWQEQRWLPSDRANTYSSFSEQGYRFEEIINKSNVSLRFRIWEGDVTTTRFDFDLFEDVLVHNVALTPYGQRQVARLHDLKIFSSHTNWDPTTSIEGTTSDNFEIRQAGKVLRFTEVANVEIYSLSGQKVSSASNTTEMDLSSLSAGAYIVKAVSTDLKASKNMNIIIR